jgi:hypothetical protein
MQTETVPLSTLVPDPNNARTHDRRNLDTIEASLRQFGQFRPFVVRREDRVILVGNGMHEAMLELGWTEGAAVFLDLTAEQASALAVVDNRSAELADWDLDALADILDELPENLAGLVGFEEGELDALLDDLPPPPPPPDPDGDGTGGEGDNLDDGDTRLVFGAYRQVVPRGKYEEVLEAIRQAVGFDEASVNAELARRIGL